jgi:hypothetical protein
MQMGIGRGTTSVALTPILDYLKPEINRPDLFEKRYDTEGHVGADKNPGSIYGTLLLIITSAFIFIAVIAWFNWLGALFDETVANVGDDSIVRSRLYQAITMTFITILEVIVFLYVYLELQLY